MINRAIVWQDDELRLASVPNIALQPNEVRIKLLLAGVCNTDLELTQGYKNFSGRLGHEFIGEVVEGNPHWLGKRVVGEINITCSDCDMCQRGEPTHCRNRHVLGISGEAQDGAFADTFRLPIDNLYAVPDGISNEQAVFAEPLAAACRITEQHSIGVRERVVLIGAGKLGLLCAYAIAQTGADLTVVVRRQKQIDILEQWGISATYQDDLPEQQADYVVDCTGNAEGFDAALSLVRPRGTIILKSTFHTLTPANLTDVVVREIKIEGSRCGNFAQALALMANPAADFSALIEGQYPLADAQIAFNHARQRGVLKILLTR